MSRKLRIEMEGGIYHITSRGHGRRRIFADNYDKRKFLAYLHEYLAKFDVTLYCYVLMRNHFHLLVQTRYANLSHFMHSLNSAYSTYYNIKQKRIGALFQGRYFDAIIESEDYFLEVTRYTHLNPVRAFIVKDPKDYQWSSYSSYLGIDDDPYISMNWITKHLGNESSKEYERFVLSKLDARNPLLQAKHFFVLGSDKFLDYLQNYIDSTVSHQSTEPQHYQSLMQKSAEDIIDFVCQHFKVDKNEIFRKKRRNLPQKMTIYLLKRFTGLTSNQIADMFLISCSAIAKICARLQEKFKRSRTFKQIRIHFGDFC